MVLSLVIVSCETEDTGGTVKEEDTGQKVTVGGEEEEQEVEEEVIEVSTDDPQYGGTITLALPADPDWNLFGLGLYCSLACYLLCLRTSFCLSARIEAWGRTRHHTWPVYGYAAERYVVGVTCISDWLVLQHCWRGDVVPWVHAASTRT